MTSAAGRRRARPAAGRTRARSWSCSPAIRRAASARGRTTFCRTPMCCCTRCVDGRRAAWRRGGVADWGPRGPGRRVLGWRGEYLGHLGFQISRPRYLSLTLLYYLFIIFFYYIFFGSWSRIFRHVNFLTPGVSSALDYKCLEAGDLGFCGLQIATPRQLVSAYEQKIVWASIIYLLIAFDVANFVVRLRVLIISCLRDPVTLSLFLQQSNTVA